MEQAERVHAGYSFLKQTINRCFERLSDFYLCCTVRSVEIKF